MFKANKKTIKAAKALCSSIIEAAGGASAIANSLGGDRQYIYKYGKLGYIPRTKVYDVAKLLQVSPWVLSYVQLVEVFGEESPSLKKIITDCPLGQDQKRELLSLLTND